MVYSLVHFKTSGPDRMSMSTLDTSSQTVPGLLHRLTTQLAPLLRQELALARTELFDSVTPLLIGAGALVVGAAVLYAGFLLLLASAVLGLAAVAPLWLASLCVGLVIGASGWGLIRRARRKLHAANLKLSHSGKSLRQDKDVL